MGDSVVIKETEELGTVSFLGSNYVIVECGDKKYRKWLDAVELVEGGTGKRQDPDIKDREGTQPARYHKGLKKSTKVARDAHFKKHGKKADDDDSAYKPAPGDATAKTKPSKYTKAFKDMYEEVSARQLNDLEKFADRILAKFDVDIEFTRHFRDRMNDDRNKPAITVNELQRVFKKIAKNKAKNIRQNPDSEAVIKDLQSDLNLPVVINYNRNKDEFEVINKTIMRKKNFKSTSKTITTETVDEKNALLALKTLARKKEYQHALKTLKDLLVRKKKEGGGKLRHDTHYYAQQIAKSYQNVNHKLLHQMLPEDAVEVAKDRINKEKEADKKKHDRIMDRARLAVARNKNRETKPND